MGSQSNNRENVEYITVDSTFGSVKGFIEKGAPNVAQFLGIPFAETPIGERRWLPPVPKPSPGNIDATAFGSSCFQYTGKMPSVYNTEAPEYRITDAMSEDCLTLSIWTPASVSRKPSSVALPVIVWITGGAFLVGGATIPYQIPTQWIESSQRHIVVTINYRLNIFGFPNAKGIPLTEQNLGLLDQRLGLEWVQAHIGSFGGDPSRITHWGQSAGGKSVDFHAFSHPNNPIVRNLIMNSGVSLPRFQFQDPEQKQFSLVAKGLGFPGGDSAAELEFMRTVPGNKILEFITDYNEGPAESKLRFMPIEDNCTVFSDYEERAKQGKFSKLPAIIGTTADEGNSLTMPFNPEGCDVKRAESITTDYFLKPAISLAEARSAHAPTFRYLFRDPAPPSSSSFPNISPRPWLRAYHSSDLPLIFGTHSVARGRSTLLECKISRAWQELYVAFAEDGPQGLISRGWKEMKDGEGIIIGPGEKGWMPVHLDEIHGEKTSL